MRLNLRLHPQRDADLIAHLARLRDGALSDELRRLLRAGLNGGGTRAAPLPFVAPLQEPAEHVSDDGGPAPQGTRSNLSDVEANILGATWE